MSGHALKVSISPLLGIGHTECVLHEMRYLVAPRRKPVLHVDLDHFSPTIIEIIPLPTQVGHRSVRPTASGTVNAWRHLKRVCP